MSCIGAPASKRGDSRKIRAILTAAGGTIRWGKTLARPADCVQALPIWPHLRRRIAETQTPRWGRGACETISLSQTSLLRSILPYRPHADHRRVVARLDTAGRFTARMPDVGEHGLHGPARDDLVHVVDFQVGL